MDKTKLTKKLCENERLEFKKTTSELKEGLFSISAILNKHQKELILSLEKDTEFKIIADIFFSIFKRKAESEKKAPENLGDKKTTQKTTQKILDQIKADPYITRKELAEKIGLSEDGIKFSLNQLKQNGFLKRIGPDKGGSWEVIDLWQH